MSKKLAGKNLISLRQSNKKAILRLLFRNGGLYSSDIAKRIGLSAGGTANITDEMIKDGLLKKNDAMNVVRGRRPYTLQINSQIGVIVAVLVSDVVEVRICDFAGNVVHSVDVKDEYKQASTFERAVETIQKYLEKTGKRLYAIAIGVGGKVDKDTGAFVYAPSIKDSENVNLKTMFGNAFSVPVIVYNKIVFGLIAEERFNTEVDIFNTLYIDRLGCSMYIDGKLFTGHHGFAGELGLLNIDVYSEASAKRFDDCQEYRSNYFVSPYMSFFAKKLSGDAEMTMEEWIKAYKNNDEEIVEKTHRYLEFYALVLRNLVEFMDFNNVIIHDELTRFGERALRYLEKEICASSFGKLEVKVYPSALDDDAYLKGAICVAMDETWGILAANGVE